jgi:epoxyqueuosine reductase QueG
MDKKLTAGVKEFTLSLGADLVGVAHADSFGEAPEGHRPEDILRGAQSVIVMAVRMLNACFDSAPSREYALTVETVSQELDRIAFRVGRFIQDKGFRALQVPCSVPYDFKENMGVSARSGLNPFK